MLALFFRQTYALTVQKNWIILRKHWFLNLMRCIVGPIIFAVFLSISQNFFAPPNTLGFGSPQAVYALRDVLDESTLIWADATNGAGSPSAEQIVQHVTRSFSPSQLRKVTRKDNETELLMSCPSNWRGRSECFAAITFNSLPSVGSNEPANYSIRTDFGLDYVNVKKHTSDYEKRIIPLQWAVDSAIIELQTGVTLPVPQEWPFTHLTNEEERERRRRSFVGAIDSIMVIAFWLLFTLVVYQTAGAFAFERANLLTTHLQAMGCLRAARIVSWHISTSIPYIPAWIIAALAWKGAIFSHTSAGLLVGINLVAGFSLTSWALFASTPFGRSPQLAAIVAMHLALVLAILALVFGKSSGFSLIFTFLFPPAFFIFALRAVCGFEKNLLSPVVGTPDPIRGFRLGALFGVAILTIFLYPLLTIWLEHLIFDTKAPRSGFWGRLLGKRVPSDHTPTGSDVAIQVRNLNKIFKRRNTVTAIEDLSLTIPRNGVFVLLGSNGSGKSTFNGIVSNIISPTKGTITFANGAPRPPRGTLGIVPQKNVLFNELTCFQTIRLWSAIKRPVGAEQDDVTQLLVDCDLENKIHQDAGSLSGGQKRKLQLAIGFVGGSDILLIDEATSGLDPLSRRAIWRALNAVRMERTIVFTTHFLDEADLLADEVAVLAAPGKLLANGPPVTLKSQFGRGYIVNVTLNEDRPSARSPTERFEELATRIRELAPTAETRLGSSTTAAFTLQTTSLPSVAAILKMLEEEKERYGIVEYDTHGSSLEDAFLHLMAEEEKSRGEGGEGEKDHTPAGSLDLEPVNHPEDLTPGTENKEGEPSKLALSDGRYTSPFNQALVICRKRFLIYRRSWLTPLLAVGIAVSAACISLVFMKNRHETCETSFFFVIPSLPLYLPLSDTDWFGDGGNTAAIISPPGAARSINAWTSDVPGGITFDRYIQENYKNLALGGLSVDPQSRQTTFAYEASPYSISGPVLLNLASNILANSIGNTTGPRIYAQSTVFPVRLSKANGTGQALEWISWFGLGFCAFPAFAVLYVTKERAAGIKSMQLSNGLTPLGLHLGHLLAEMPLILSASTIVIIVFGTATTQFAGLGIFWLILVLYGIAATLFSFCWALFISSPLIAFASVLAYNCVIFVLYLTGYMISIVYAMPSRSKWTQRVFHFAFSLLGPVPSVMRAAIVSVNLFIALCTGEGKAASPSTYGQLLKFGGPIIYLIAFIILFFGILVWVDSGFPLPFNWSFSKAHEHGPSDARQTPDVAAEAERVMASPSDPLRALHISKKFGNSPVKAVDDVTFGVQQETLALLGPNGAGKTTTFNIIRGGISPDGGDVFIKEVSIQKHTTEALVNLGLCPQFSAIDSHLTVREHLRIYGGLKGLSGELLNRNVEILLTSANLTTYSDRVATKLSGGNQRKLSLAIALMGNPNVLLIDEYSTGIDAATKRQMWKTLKRLAVGKAVVLTTHSLEEAVALSQRVAILAGRLLAIGSIKSLLDRYPTYEIHFSCRSAEEIARVQGFVGRCFPDSVRAEDVATRWEVPVSSDRSLASLFATLSSRSGEQGAAEYTVERLTLESVFLKVIRENAFSEEATEVKRRKFWGLF